MKKILFVFTIIVLISVILCGCDFRSVDGFVSNGYKSQYQEKIEMNREAYPFYSSLTPEKKELYIDICTAIESHSSSSVPIGEYDSREEAKGDKDWLKTAYMHIVYENPEYFWANPYAYELNEIEYGDEYKLTLSVSYVIDKDTAEAYKVLFDKKVNEIKEAANAQPELFDRVLYVYDAILSNASYDHELAESDGSNDIGRSAYGCLVEGNTVCSGYAMAFNLLMRELGIEAGVEFNNYDGFSIISGHVWNYCKLEEDYYYFDLTWDDSGFDSEEYKPYIDFSHTYFGVTEEELSKTNFTMSSDAPTPDCNGTKYNYFVYKSRNFAQYEKEAVENAVREQAENKYIELRFDSYGELLVAERELLNSGRIYEILEGKKNIKYVISNTSLHLYIFFD